MAKNPFLIPTQWFRRRQEPQLPARESTPPPPTGKPQDQQANTGYGPVVALPDSITWNMLLDPTLGREYVLWCIAKTPTEVTLTIFDSSHGGLGLRTALDRQKVCGKNTLSISKPLPWWQSLLRSFGSPFNVLLVLLASLSVATPEKEWANFSLLMLMSVISVLLRFSQERKSTLAAINLQTAIKTDINLIRFVSDNPNPAKSVEVPVAVQDLVPGDILVLRPGDTIPADCLLLEAQHLQISQSSLTGEGEPQQKGTRYDGTATYETVFDLPNIAFMGTTVVSGTGTGLVVGTGDHAHIASITEELSRKKPPTAFEEGILWATFAMIAFMASTILTVFIIRGRLSGEWQQAAEFSLGLAVAVIPEMLPAIVNTNLARGARKLAKSGAIVKDIGAIQNFGSMKVLCSDKTGTLTAGSITLHLAENCLGRESREVLELAFTTAVSRTGKKSDIDMAILQAGAAAAAEMDRKLNLGEWIADIPFQFEKRISGSIARTPRGDFLVIIKGAIEEVLAATERIKRTENDIVALTDAQKTQMLAKAFQYNDDGYRVLGIASKTVGASERDGENDSDREVAEKMAQNYKLNLVFEGFLVFLDLLRDDGAAAVASLQQLGVEIKVLTGDNERVARKICRDLKIFFPDVEAGLQSITGLNLSRLSPKAFASAVQHSTVFAKLTPSQKSKIVVSLKQHCSSASSAASAVGMLGDGINDCAGLRFADVGISVSSAAPAAKDCADVILTDQARSLSVVVAGVRTGRAAHANTVKYIKMAASANFGNVVSVLVATAWLPYQPMTGLQILVQNLLYDIAQFALPWDRVDDEDVAKPLVWDWRDLVRFVLVFGPVSSLSDVATFCFNWLALDINEGASPLVPMAQTHWFLSGLVTQLLVVHVLRTGKVPLWESRSHAALAAMTISVMIFGLALPYIKVLSRHIGLVEPDPIFLGFLAWEVIVYCLVVQAIKVVYKRCFGVWL
ncbi:magnesium-translocating P-type ATPase [Lasiosphaeris hirsuta]|uniref:Magnesium-transporting ATPase, P-type 1 n=1 Tax=Lasiosphaeris hirsuta TaxID=260670 RepID=A0AA40EAC4_9PEZI|nr:magnesium-translocating P-type ATPase [Lasiosphaeris hirsuta]